VRRFCKFEEGAGGEGLSRYRDFIHRGPRGYCKEHTLPALSHKEELGSALFEHGLMLFEEDRKEFIRKITL
jgi:hypothetical protein